MPIIRLTAKRQATLPRALCEEMNLEPGDALLVDAKTLAGKKVWVLTPAKDANTAWFGSLKRYAKAKSHHIGAVRKSIGKARRHGKI